METQRKLNRKFAKSRMQEPKKPSGTAGVSGMGKKPTMAAPVMPAQVTSSMYGSFRQPKMGTRSESLPNLIAQVATQSQIRVRD